VGVASVRIQDFLGRPSAGNMPTFFASLKAGSAMVSVNARAACSTGRGRICSTAFAWQWGSVCTEHRVGEGRYSFRLNGRCL